MPSEIERFNVGDDPDHPGFSEMYSAPSGHWVRYSDHLAEVERVEMEELDKHADLTEQFANKLAAKDEEIERVRKHEQETAEVAVRRVEKAEQEIKRQHRLRIDAAQAHAKALAKRDEEARKQRDEELRERLGSSKGFRALERGMKAGSKIEFRRALDSIFEEDDDAK